MKKLFFFLSVFAWLISANIAYADVTAPNVTIQNGGAVSVVWNAPASQTTKVSVFIPNNATAINALYRVYPNGKSATNTACLSTDATKPCFEIPVNQALNKNKWVQLTLNNDVNTQWTFVKNTGFVTVASNNLGASENLGVAGADFSVSALNTKQIAAKWAKAIAAASGIKKAIGQCLKNNGGIAVSLCDSAGIDPYTTLGKYGILQSSLDTMNSAANAETYASIDTTHGVDWTTSVSIGITESTAGRLGGCSFHLVPTVQGGVGIIVWQVLAKMESAPATADSDCVKFVQGSVVSTTPLIGSSGGYISQNAFRAKWAKAIAAASGIKKAIAQCLKDNGGTARDLCDSAGVDTTMTLGKYGVTQSGLDTLNYPQNAETHVSIGIDYGTDANTMVSIDITEANPAKLGGCSFHLVPTVQGGAGTIVWQVLAKHEGAPALDDASCTSLVKGSIVHTTPLYGTSRGSIYQNAFRAKWAKAIAAASGIKQAIAQCLKDNGGIALNRCDSAGADANSTLGKYGILQNGLSTMNSAVNAETKVSISTQYGADVNTMVSIDITELSYSLGIGKLGGCSFHLVPTVQGGAGTIVWQVLAKMEAAPAFDDSNCTALVKGSVVSTIALGGGGGYAFPTNFRAKWVTALTTLPSIKQAITRCLLHNAGDKTQCDSVLIVKDKLQKYGISSLPAGTGSSDGATASDSRANWISMKMGNAGASDAAIVIQGGSQLADCKVTVQPSYDAGARYVKWSVFAQATNTLADNAKCASYINGAIAGAPI